MFPTSRGDVVLILGRVMIMPFWQISWLFFLKIEKMLAECQNVKYNISKGQIVKQIKRNRVLL